MDEELSDDQLQSGLREMGAIVRLCEKHGEADGANAMRSIERAIKAEIEARKG